MKLALVVGLAALVVTPAYARQVTATWTAPDTSGRCYVNTQLADGTGITLSHYDAPAGSTSVAMNNNNWRSLVPDQKYTVVIYADNKMVGTIEATALPIASSHAISFRLETKMVEDWFKRSRKMQVWREGAELANFHLAGNMAAWTELTNCSGQGSDPFAPKR